MAILEAMFEVVERGAEIDKKTWEKRVGKLRTELLAAQYAILEAAKLPVLVLVNGVDGASKSETVNLLTEWMDPRHIHAHAFAEASDEELERPPMYRFWRRLPPKGQMGIFFGNWYTQPIIERAEERTTTDHFTVALEEIRRFERMLVAEGALVVKLWFHLSKKQQKKRMRELLASKRTAWRVGKDDRKRFERYDEFRVASEAALRATDLPEAPWILVEGADFRHASLTAGETLLAAMQQRLAEKAEPADTTKAKAERRTKKKHAPSILERHGDLEPIVRTIDLSQKMAKDEYEDELAKWQRRLSVATRHKRFRKLSPVLVFEGMDAAGKGGTIRRVTQALDARVYQVVAVAAPSDEERAQPYLWRFWRHAPRDGKVVIFDRSWYGRVLVERVEGFAAAPDWMRAYDEINDFEAQLTRAGNVVVKFWLQVSLEEQLRRFKEREATPWKQFKITPDDWRNREKWPDYEVAASDMITRTSTEWAPWTMVSAEDKHVARVTVLKTAVQAIEKALGG